MTDQDKADLLKVITLKYPMPGAVWGARSREFFWRFRTAAEAQNIQPQICMWLATAGVTLSAGSAGTVFRLAGQSQEELILDFDRMT